MPMPGIFFLHVWPFSSLDDGLNVFICSFLFFSSLRENATADKVKEAHRKVMVANHPDAGGSHYLASKINEAKDVMLGKTKGSGSAF